MPSSLDASIDPVDLASLIDHSLLVPTATLDHLERWCMEADRDRFATVCIYPCFVEAAVELLHNKQPKVCAVIGFPSGASTAAVKLYEAQDAVERGAAELDVVLNLGWIRMGMTDPLHQEIAAIVEETGVPVKAILETTLLTPDEIQLAAEVCIDAGVTYLKTSTGWNGGATVEQVRLLHDLAQGRVGVKASGGIRTAEQAIALVLAGASRIGTSRGPDLLRETVLIGEDGA